MKPFIQLEDRNHRNVKLEAPRILVVDDDPSFGKIMAHVAEKTDVVLAACHTVQDLRKLILTWSFDAVIMDYFFGDLTGIQLTKYIEHFRGPIPIILVSQTKPLDSHLAEWPSSINGFIHKSVGHEAILQAAIAASNMPLNYLRLMKPK